MSVTPQKEWWSAADLAASGLPDIPTTKRGLTKMIDRQNWVAQPGLVRRRSGRGGGFEYHWSLLPQRAQQHLLLVATSDQTEKAEAEQMSAAEAWTYYDKLADKAKAKATSRLKAIQLVEALERGGLTKDQAVRNASKQLHCGVRSIWNWFDMIAGIAPSDRLPYLADRHKLAKRQSRAAEIDPTFGEMIKADYLRLGEPDFTACYDRIVRHCEANGIPVASKSATRRWLDRTVSKVTQVLARKGVDAAKAMFPPQERDKTAMHALEAVNADFHTFDVFVRFPGANGEPDTIQRPHMVAIQDIYSARVLAWRIDTTSNGHAVQLAFGDLFREYGIPYHVLLDNGREFANKALTGGAPTRFRFKVKEDDIPGLLTALDVVLHWATPYHGQAKPIERAFRDMCGRIAKHPAFHGAYTGNSPTAKPEDYGSRAVPLEEFLAVLADEIQAHNTRTGRRSEVAMGRSFADVFDESYATAPIRKATKEQERLWLMGVEGLTVNRRTGTVKFQGNTFWAPFLHEHLGKKIAARFDYNDFFDGLHIYALNGEYLGHAECREKVGFFDADEARIHARARKDWLNAEKAALKAHKTLTNAELAKGLSTSLPPEPAAKLEAKVVKMVPNTAKKFRTVAAEQSTPEIDKKRDEIVADLASHRATKPKSRRIEEVDNRELYRRALELERKLEAGDDITSEQKRWLHSYQDTSDYRSMQLMVKNFGEAYLAK